MHASRLRARRASRRATHPSPPGGSPRAPRTPRGRRSAAAVLGCAVLLTTALSSCSAAEKLTTGMKVKSAVEKLGSQPSASVVASLDATPGDTYAYLRAIRGASGGAAPTRHEAELLARMELAFAVGSERTETALKDLDKSDRLDLATAVTFGGTDVIGVKTVKEQLYVRVNLRAAAQQLGGSSEQRDRARTIREMAEKLPSSLHSAADALRGEWVRIDPESFDEFAETADELVRDGGAAAARRAGKAAGGERGERAAQGSAAAGELSGRITDVTSTVSSLNGESIREFVDGLGTTLRRHATFSAEGERRGEEHYRVTMPGRAAAKGLVTALRPLGAAFDPTLAPDRTVRADLTIRRGQLTGLRVDLGQFTTWPGERDGNHGEDGEHGKDSKDGKRGEDGGGGSGERPALPLTLEFGGGDVVSVRAPDGTRELKPQDLLTAVMYGALGTGGIRNP
ncbi:hypothetical protein [Streptomyces sp. AJS327]|uniref:hypothetical protein n=1 Tax=Streptomyces sp. AJS327 TaxID=2545265 RepID=UPI002155ED32|nr:hypothetical protein [Streptomyces sp. AJS327]